MGLYRRQAQGLVEVSRPGLGGFGQVEGAARQLEGATCRCHDGYTASSGCTGCYFDIVPGVGEEKVGLGLDVAAAAAGIVVVWGKEA